MNELIEKLNKIYLPKVTSLPSGESKDISNFWEGLVKKYLPCKNTVLHWHKVLMQYIKYEDAVFAIRTFNNAHPQKYDTLRRGFLTATNRGYSYFYTDNFFAAYFQKMAMDNFVPAAADLVNALKLRKFPSRFGRNTSNERVLLAMPQGKDPRINDAGFKIAHILSVGRDYYYQGEMFSLTNIVSKYFPRGERDDWRLTVDSGNEYFLRKLEVEGVARKFLVAQFLRFVHPFNYFLSPQKKFEKNSVCIEIAEYKPLLDYAYDYNMRTYGDAFLEFLQLVMTDDISFRKSDGSKVINIEYGRGIQK
ncbi:MAG: hypothetical protein FWC11_05490, partial [Firmicutes bacterium]|nr:hypothetical protein [Bacillota bacterium]